MKVIKSLSIILLVLTTLSCSNKAGKESPTDWETMKLKGKVKSFMLRNYKFSYDEGKSEENLEATATALFNEAGRLVDFKSYDVDSSGYLVKFDEAKNQSEIRYIKKSLLPKSKELISYDEKGQIIERLTYDDDSLLKRYTCAYSERGKKVEEAWYNALDFLTTKLTYQYNDKDSLVALVECNALDGVIKKFTYLYNDKGQMIESKKLLSEKEGEWIHTYTYDEQGKVVQDLEIYPLKLYPDSSIHNKRICKYDKQGNLIEEGNYNYVGGLKSRHIYKYDDKGNKIESSSYDEYDSLMNRKTFLYDEEGSLIEQKFYERDSLWLRESFEYKYDDRGNWIECSECRDTLMQSIVKREFEYFD